MGGVKTEPAVIKRVKKLKAKINLQRDSKVTIPWFCIVFVTDTFLPYTEYMKRTACL